ncbi:hypothetical protein AVEN_30712-1, partial [Araneus ventricosus]
MVAALIVLMFAESMASSASLKHLSHFGN